MVLIAGLATAGEAQRDPELLARIRFLEPVEKLARDGRPAEAREHALRLLPAIEAAHGESSFEVAALLDEIAGLAYSTGRAADPAAAAAIDRSLRIKRTILGGDHPEVARSLNAKAVLLGVSGHPEAAQPLYEQALRIRREAHGPGARSVAESLMNLAVLHGKQGRYDEAWPLAREALAIREASFAADHPLIATTALNLGRLALLRGDYGRAWELVDRSRRIVLRAHGEDHPQLVFSYQNLSQLAHLQGDWRLARENADEALRVALAAHGEHHPLVASVQANLADLHLRLGQLSEARRLASASATAFDVALGPEHPDSARALQVLADVEAREAGAEAARALLERVLAIRRKAFPAAHPATAESLLKLAAVSRDEGDLDGAERLSLEALAVRREVLGGEHPGVAAALAELARLASLRGERQDAFKLGLEAESLGRRHLQGTLRSLPEREGLAYAARRVSSLDLLLSLLAQMPEPDFTVAVWQALASGRALVLDEMAHRHRHSDEATVESQLAALARIRERLARQIYRGPDPQNPSHYRHRLATAVARKDAAERALARASVGFRRQQEVREVRWPDVAAMLAEDTGLVSFARFERSAPGPGNPATFYMAFVGRSRGPLVAVPLASGEAIDSAVDRWSAEVSRPPQPLRTAARRAEERYRRAAAELARLVWQPLEPLLEGIDKLLIVPDGELFRVSIPTLVNRHGRYLVEAGPRVQWLSAERELLSRPSAAAGRGLLAVAAPDFGSATESSLSASSGADAARALGCEDLWRFSFDDLPGARQEAARIIEVWNDPNDPAAARGPVQQLSGAQASEERFKALAPGSRILHLATHGFFLDRACFGARSPELENPLLFAGLALAGFNRRRQMRDGEEDGVLTAEEIASLDLAGVETVVLSACGSGLGPVHAGEGVLGLQRAFRIAGVETLVMSLWAVEDAATREWMVNLYKAWGAGLGTAEAVRAASLSLLRDRRRLDLSTHPFYWGAFVSAGGS